MPRAAVRPAQPEPPKGPGPVGACCRAQRRFDVRIGGSVGRSLEDGGGRTEQGLPEGQVEVDRPGTVGAAAGLGERPGRQRPPGPGGGQLGGPRVHLPPDSPTEEAFLVDGLGGAKAVELWRAVGRYGHHGHPGVVGFDDRRVQFGGGGAARRYDRCRHPRRQGQAESEEPGRTLVGQYMEP